MFVLYREETSSTNPCALTVAQLSIQHCKMESRHLSDFSIWCFLFKSIDQISRISTVVNYYIVSDFWISDIRWHIWNSHPRRLSLGQNTAFIKVTIKLSRRIDTNKIRVEKNKLNGKYLTLLRINTTVDINDSLCIYCKKLWAKLN